MYQLLEPVPIPRRQGEIKHLNDELNQLKQEWRELNRCNINPGDMDWMAYAEELESVEASIQFNEKRLEWLNSVTDEDYEEDDGIPF